ncbi:ribonuclease H-like domain-containing protein [Tanacetum coccineum]
MVKPMWNNAQRANHQNFAKKTYPCAKKNLVPRAVLIMSGLVSINTARQNISKTAVLVNTTRQVNAAHSKTTVNVARPMLYLSKTAHSTVKRPIHKNTSFKNNNINQRVNTDQGVINSGYSRHMTGNMSYLIDYEEIDGGYVTFGGNPKGGKITGKGTIKLNSVLFNDTECIVLSPNFKLLDESQVLLRVLRKNNMYSVDLKNIVPKGATKDETRGILKSFITGIENLVDTSVARTPQQNGVAKRRNMTLTEAARTMLADSKLPTTFWTEVVNTACYVVEIECYSKLDGKADECFFVGYFLNSKSFRVFNSRTRIVDGNLHIRFSKSTPNAVVIMQVKLERRQNLSRNNILLPLGLLNHPYSQDPKSSHNDGSKPSSDDGKKVDENPRKDSECRDQEKEDNVNSTNTVNAAGTNEVNLVGGKTSIKLPFDLNMHALEDDSIFDF